MSNVQRMELEGEEFVYQCIDCGAYKYMGPKEAVKCHPNCSPPDPKWFECVCPPEEPCDCGFRNEEDDESLSPCCGVALIDDCDLCPRCKEHC